jgi:mannose-6-phosphate isomerase-like protein (cupin superfamily)
MVKPYVADLKKAAKDNNYFRKVLFTGGKSQLVLMSLQPVEEIGNEVHEVDQVIYAVEGEGKVVLDGVGEPFEKGMVVCVPAGVHHNVINAKHGLMKLFTVYAPPEHAVGTVHQTKAEADAAEEHFAPAPAAGGHSSLPPDVDLDGVL